MNGLYRIASLCAALALVPVAAACSGDDRASRAKGPASASQDPASSGLVATRWWSNSAVTAGSTIDPATPQAAAAKLRVSKTDYCAMLRQTLAAGHSILPGVTAKDPALLASTKAFIAEIEKVAPPLVTGPWHVLGGAVVALVASGGDAAKVTGIDAKAVRNAATAISADAKSGCNIDLASARPTK